jgi:hypothetical protein
MSTMICKLQLQQQKYDKNKFVHLLGKRKMFKFKDHNMLNCVEFILHNSKHEKNKDLHNWFHQKT